MWGAYRALSTLSQRAHALAAVIHGNADPRGLGDLAGLTPEQAQAQLAAVEAEIDERAAELWGLTEKELKEIKRSLEELG